MAFCPGPIIGLYGRQQEHRPYDRSQLQKGSVMTADRLVSLLMVRQLAWVLTAVPTPDGAVVADSQQHGSVPGQRGLPHSRCALYPDTVLRKI